MAKKSAQFGVYRVTEIIGASKVSREEVATNAVETAAKSLRELPVAEVRRLCAAIRELNFDAGGQVFGVSVSIGVAMLAATDGDVATLMARADAALYLAKGAGRDRVIVSCVGAELLSTAS